MKKVRGKCPKCLTGKETYELDSREPMCPYIHTYNKKRKCPYYAPLNELKNGFISRLLERVMLPPEKLPFSQREF